jgi:hypothetical protein
MRREMKGYSPKTTDNIIKLLAAVLSFLILYAIVHASRRDFAWLNSL